jgi:copper chaperone NosL
MRAGALRAHLAALTLLVVACDGGAPRPAELDTRHESCRFCRMTVSERPFAAQVVAPGEEPVFFDDLGCLRDFLGSGGTLPPGAVAFVADHRTAEWVPGATALFTAVPTLQTPMASHLVAHAGAASRDADPAAAGGRPVDAAAIFGPGGAPGTP